jgi:hypothetical protein
MAIGSTKCRQLSTDVLLHNNAHPHTAETPQQLSLYEAIVL